MNTLYHYLLSDGLAGFGAEFLRAHAWIAAVIAALVAWVIPVLLIALPLAGFSTYVERKLAAAIQRRVGPNQAGPYGLLQFMADGIKLLFKEDLTPREADRPLFKLAPYIVCTGAFTALVTLAWSQNLFTADLNIGVFFIMAATSVVAVGILIAGWSSNNKWSLFGGMRAAAQIVSYEIPAALFILTAVLLAGTLQMGGITAEQGGWFWNWYVLGGPQHGLGLDLGGKVLWHALLGLPMLVAAIAYYIAGLAESNRTPFDMPEAENELVAGYHTEYTGLRFGFFFVAEYVDMFIVSAILATLWLGGCNSGLPPLDNLVRSITGGFAGLSPVLRLVVIGAVGAPVGIFVAVLLLRRYPGRKLLIRAIVAAGALGGVAAAAVAALLPGDLIQLLGFGLYQAAIFIGKSYILVLGMMWIRWTWPRFRIDQMMNLCWKRLVPIGFACLLAVGVLLLVRAHAASPEVAASALGAAAEVTP